MRTIETPVIHSISPPVIHRGLTICVVAVALCGCAANRDGQQAQIGTRDILPNARNISPDVEADNAQIGGTRAAAGAQVVEVHTNGMTAILVLFGGTVLAGLVFGVLLYRSNPPTKGTAREPAATVRPVG